MVEKRNCSFCGEDIEPGTGKMFVKKDGTVYTFCSNKCKKNRIDLGRVPRRTKWTIRYNELKASSLSREVPKKETKEADSKKSAPKKKAALPAVKEPKAAAPKKKVAPAKKAKPVKKEAAEKKSDE